MEDPLFMVQRYWGSDEEDNFPENSFNDGSYVEQCTSDKNKRKHSKRVKTVANESTDNIREKYVVDSGKEDRRKSRKHLKRVQTEASESTDEVVEVGISNHVKTESRGTTDEVIEEFSIGTEERKKKKNRKHLKREHTEANESTDEVVQVHTIDSSKEMKTELSETTDFVIEEYAIDFTERKKRKSIKHLKRVQTETNESTDEVIEQYTIHSDEEKKRERNKHFKQVKTEITEGTDAVEECTTDSGEGKKRKSRKRRKQAKTEPSESIGEVVNKHIKQKPDKMSPEKSFSILGEAKNKNYVKIDRSLPKWLANPTLINVDLHGEQTPISNLGYLDSLTKKNLETMGIKFLFPVQKSVIPWLMSSVHPSARPSDICVSAPTGSGKTLAFVIPIVQALKNRVEQAVRAIVVLPVGDLAVQVYKVFEMFVKGTDLSVVLVTGQKSFSNEQKLLVKSGVRGYISLADIIVSTSGRLMDHVYKTPGFSLKSLRYLIIDEADRTVEDIRQSRLKEIENAVYGNYKEACSCIPSDRTPIEPFCACCFGQVQKPMQKLLYSATLSHDPELLHDLMLYKPKLFTTSNASDKPAKVSVKCTLPESLSELCVVCLKSMKALALCYIIQKYGFKRTLCFTEKVKRAHNLYTVLEQMKHFTVREMSSQCTPVQRKIILSQFTTGKVDILICSDLIARGMDIKDTDCVISYDIPKFIKTYIHRVGRTARAGKQGTAITILSEAELANFKRMLKLSGKAAPSIVRLGAQELKQFEHSFKKSLKLANDKLRSEKSKKVALRRKRRKIKHRQSKKAAS